MIFHLHQTTLDRDYLAARRYQAMPTSVDFANLLVNKPWGNEYLMYNNPFVEIWNLSINHGKATSMHCHPNKKTALVVLEGKALFSSLNESIELSPMSAVVLGPGVFHTTQAVSSDGIKMLEFETPPMKHDLVRLEDRYGRTNKGYERTSEMVRNDALLRFSDSDIGIEKKLWNNSVGIQQSTQTSDLAVIIAGAVVSSVGVVERGLIDILKPEEFPVSNGHHARDLKFFTIKRNV